MWLKIFEWLNPRDILAIRLVCRQWAEMISQYSTLRRLCTLQISGTEHFQKLNKQDLFTRSVYRVPTSARVIDVVHADDVYQNDLALVIDNLETMHLEFNDQDLSHFWWKMTPKLKTFDLTVRKRRVTIYLPQSFVKVSTFRLHVLPECSKVVIYRMRMNENLEHLELDTRVVSKETPLLQLIGENFPNLRTLILNGTKCDSTGISGIFQNLLSLEHLELTLNYPEENFDRKAFKHIGRLRGLRYLRLGNCTLVVSDRFFLKHLHLPLLNTLYFYSEAEVAVTDAGIRGLIQNCPALRTLSMGTLNKITDSSLEYLQAQPRLEFFCVSGELITKKELSFRHLR